MSRPQSPVAPPLPPSPPPPYPGIPFLSPPSLQSYPTVDSPPAEVMTEEDLEKYWEIHDSIVDYFYEVTQQKLKDLCGDRDTSQLSEEEIKKLDKIIDEDVENSLFFHTKS